MSTALRESAAGRAGAADGAGSCDATGAGCHVCGDVAIQGRVQAVDPAARTATVRFAGGSATVALDLVDASVGDVLLIHLGFAIARLEGM